MLEQWIDSNGLIKPRKDWIDSGNGVLYTAVYLLLTDFVNLDGFTHPIGKCFRNGQLYRTPPTPDDPHGKYGQESWDNYLGLAAICALKNFRKMARLSIWRGIKNFGFYDSDGVPEWKDWLWRFPQVWLIMWVAAFPCLKWPLYPLFRLIPRLMKADPENASGVQLEWVFIRVASVLYPNKFQLEYNQSSQKFEKAMVEYYESGHPIIDAWIVKGWQCTTLY